MMTSVALAGQGKPGSTVIVCTDGMANIGRSDIEFYQQIGSYAKEYGVTVNVVAIAGDQCDLASLQHVCEITGGMIDYTDPKELKSNFTGLLARPVIATNVIAKVKLHKALCFRKELPKNITQDGTMLTVDKGNVTEEDLFTFEY